MATPKYAGVDLSYANANVDYKQLAMGSLEGCRVKFAMLRYSYGTNKDKLFDKHYDGCKAAGLYVGAYHWLRAQTPAAAKAEAEWLVKQLEAYSIDYPVALDFEDADLFALKLSKAQYTAIVDAFMSVLQAANYYVILYTNPDTIQNRLNADILKRYDLWLAHWTTKPAAYEQTMWQYAALGTTSDVKAKRATRVGTVSGAGGPCDVNWSYVGYAAKIKAAGKNRKKMQTNEPAAVNYAVIASKTAIKNDLQKITGQLKALGFTVNSFEVK